MPSRYHRGACDGSVQSDTSSSPSEQSHLGHSHPAFSMGPQTPSLVPVHVVALNPCDLVPLKLQSRIVSERVQALCTLQGYHSDTPVTQEHLVWAYGGLRTRQPALPPSLLVAQQLANAVGGVMSGAAQGMNQPILIPFNAGGHLGGQQGLVLSLPTANLQSLVAAAAAGGLMTLPLQNLQAPLNEACWHSTSVRQLQLWPLPPHPPSPLGLQA
ncbi:hypothetical protein NQZ68_013700 [Dissostichus eleginoides]|nr:hypothetical protein NQZ68_013700 [Dissostichus eleginoides]